MRSMTTLRLPVKGKLPPGYLGKVSPWYSSVQPEMTRRMLWPTQWWSHLLEPEARTTAPFLTKWSWLTYGKLGSHGSLNSVNPSPSTSRICQALSGFRRPISFPLPWTRGTHFPSFFFFPVSVENIAKQECLGGTVCWVTESRTQLRSWSQSCEFGLCDGLNTGC